MKPDRMFAIAILVGVILGATLQNLDYYIFEAPSKELIYSDHRRTVRILWYLYQTNPAVWKKPLCLEILRTYSSYTAWYFGANEDNIKEIIREEGEVFDYFYGVAGYDIHFSDFVYGLGLPVEITQYIYKNKMWELDY